VGRCFVFGVWCFVHAKSISMRRNFRCELEEFGRSRKKLVATHDTRGTGVRLALDRKGPVDSGNPQIATLFPRSTNGWRGQSGDRTSCMPGKGCRRVTFGVTGIGRRAMAPASQGHRSSSLQFTEKSRVSPSIESATDSGLNRSDPATRCRLSSIFYPPAITTAPDGLTPRRSPRHTSCDRRGPQARHVPQVDYHRGPNLDRPLTAHNPCALLFFAVALTPRREIRSNGFAHKPIAAARGARGLTALDTG